MKNRPITIAFSPCPNDTFIFDALINRKIDTRGLTFEPVLKDVEELNKDALSGIYDITKLSFGAYPLASTEYIILDSGAALGNGVGPLLVSRSKEGIDEHSSVAIPGKHTTANLLFTMFYPQNKNTTQMVFHEIPEAVSSGRYDCGILIHEGRFTYEKKGLQKISDLGDLWEKSTGMPVPLGCIAGKRELGNESLKVINELISESIRSAFNEPGSSMDYIRLHSQELDDHVIRQHIALYVNDYSIDLGVHGKEAIGHLFGHCEKMGLFPYIHDRIFIE